MGNCAPSQDASERVSENVSECDSEFFRVDLGGDVAKWNRGKWADRKGKIIGEFICDRIYELAPLNHAPDDVEKQACLTREEIVNYLKGAGYGWHISDLRIYDTPKELSEFKTLCRVDANCCACPYYNYTKMDCDGRVIGRPPQSWCYVEEG